jgi:hypothetical protein
MDANLCKLKPDSVLWTTTRLCMLQTVNLTTLGTSPGVSVLYLFSFSLLLHDVTAFGFRLLFSTDHNLIQPSLSVCGNYCCMLTFYF